MRGLHGLDDLQKVVIAITEDKCEILRNMNISDEVLAAMRFEDNMNVLNLANDLLKVGIVKYLATQSGEFKKQLIDHCTRDQSRAPGHLNWKHEPDPHLGH